jgi:probable HAF family extracellular repeat protein
MRDLGTLAGANSKVSYADAVNSTGDVAGGTEGAPPADGTFASWGNGFLWRQGTVTDLGSLGRWSRVADINDKGQVVGWSEPLGGVMHAYLWQNGKMTDLGTLGGDQSIALALNESSQIVGYSLVNPDVAGSYAIDHAFLWQDGKMRDLGTLPDGKRSFAYAINERGAVVGSAETGTTGSEGAPLRHAVLWQDGQMRDLGTLGGDESQAVALNERGQIVGSSATRNGATHAVLWQDGQMRDLGTLGGAKSTAVAINERGQVIGKSTTKHGAVHAFVWQDGAMRDLGTLGGLNSEATAINERGQIVGTSETAPPAKAPPAALQTIAYSAAYKQPPNGWITGIYTSRNDGSHRWRLIDDASGPAWSPDGRQIAYTYDSQIIAVANADGSGRRELDVGPSFCRTPAWSRDGGQIACAGAWYEAVDDDMQLHTALFAVELSSGKTRTLLPDTPEDTTPSWSPDGRRIALDTKTSIVVLDLKTHRTQRLARGMTPDWSPNGKLIAYSTGHAIAVIDPAGHGRRTVVASTDFLATPCWSPDGTRLLYTVATKNAIRGIYTVGLDGKSPRLLVRGGYDADWRPRTQGPG